MHKNLSKEDFTLEKCQTDMSIYFSLLSKWFDTSYAFDIKQLRAFVKSEQKDS